MLSVHLLQTPRVELDGVLLSLPVKRADALLYYMTVQRSATRQELIALLWEDCDEATGLKNLRNTLYSIKKALGGDFLLAPQKSLLVVNGAWEIECDYQRFLESGDPALYRGPFLQGFAVRHAFAFDEWVGSVREKLRERYLAEILRRAEAAAQRGDEAEAVRLAGEYLREDPYNESVVALLMSSCCALGEYARAAQAYQRLKKQLAEELGTEPLERTTLRYYELMNRWNDTTKAEAGSERRPAVPVGREEIYDALRAGVSSVGFANARSCNFLLTGETGSGKSELINYLLSWNDLSSFLVLRGECLQSEERFSLLPWSRIMRQLWEFASEEELALPISVQARLEQTFLRAGEPGERRLIEPWNRSLEECFVVFISTIARRKRLLLVLETVQWLDEDSARLLDALLRRAVHGEMMTILTCGEALDHGPGRLLTQLETDGLLNRQRLRALTERETRALIAQELGEAAAEQLYARYYRQTGGNITLLQALIRAGGRGTAGQDLEGILLGGVSGLPEGAMHVAKLISVFPGSVSGGMLLRMIGGDDRLLGAGLDALRSRGIIEEYHERAESYYRFAHSKVRDIVSARISAHERKPLYARAAAVVAQEHRAADARSCRELAHYYELAGDAAAALSCRVQAMLFETSRACVPFSDCGGDEPQPAAFDALREGTERLRRELTALRGKTGESPLTERLGCLLTETAGCIELFRGEIAAGSDLLGNISGLPGGHDSATMLRVCYALSVAAVYRQETEKADRYAATGLRLLAHEQDALRRAQFQRLRGCCFCLRKSYDKASYYLLEAIDTLERLPESTAVQLQLAAAYGDYARVCRHKNGYAEACTYFKKALSLLSDGAWPGMTWLYVHYGRTVFNLDDHAKACELFEAAFRASERSGELMGRAAAACYTAYYLAQEKDYDRAAERLREARRCQDLIGSPLEGGILCFVSMELRRRLEWEGRMATPLGALLSYPSDSYARQGVRLLADIPDVFEAELLARGLREGISERPTYRASELYSKTRHFMTE